ncbi:MAG TPA: PIG-L family deacetylase, partial [Kineosporiaceae bacterium]|nr:PIG-L family deacetylase [Kineosporiaceae bacterium]
MTTSMGPQAERRLLLVHAHPDDESINTGATMAKYAAEGAQVTLITCTRGEQGEVIPERLARLVQPGASADVLGDHRVGELAAAMAELGVVDHRFLGDPASPGRPAGEAEAAGGTVYRDSGMAYDRDGGVVPAPVQQPGAFAPATVGESVERPAEQLAAVIRGLRPHVVVTYEPGGGYGHPDHVQTHLVTMRAVELAALDGPADPPAPVEPRGPGSAPIDPRVPGSAPGVSGSGESRVPGWSVPKVYWVVSPNSWARATLGAFATAEGADYRGPDPAGRMPSEVIPDDQVTTAIDAIKYTGAKVAALRAHETQVTVSADDAFFALSNDVRRPVLGLEFYR